MGMTNYNVAFDPGVPGSSASGIMPTIVAKTNASGGVLAYGRAVVQGTAAKDVILPASNKVDFVGVVYRDYQYESVQTADGAEGVPNKKEISVMIGGDIWVEVEEAVAPGDPVYFRIATSPQSGGPAIVGKFRKSADTDTAPTPDVDTAVLVSRARWVTSTTGAGIAQLRINLP